MPMTAALLESPFGMRWTTVLMAGAILLLIGIWKRRPLIAVAALLAWAGGFEVTFRALDIVRWREWWAISAWAWEAAALAGWVIAAYAFGVRPSIPWVAVTVATLGVWFATGFDYNLPQTVAGQHQVIRWWPEILNVIAKTAWGMAYMLGALSPPGVPWYRRRPSLRESPTAAASARQLAQQ